MIPSPKLPPSSLTGGRSSLGSSVRRNIKSAVPTSVKQGVGLFFTYQFVRRLVTPWTRTKAFELGIIDSKGRKLKSPETNQEKNTYTTFDRLVYNIKRLLQKVPGGGTTIGSWAAALALLRENHANLLCMSDRQIALILENNIKALREDAPANAAGTGANVAGLGKNPPIDHATALRRRRLNKFMQMWKDSNVSSK